MARFDWRKPRGETVSRGSCVTGRCFAYVGKAEAGGFTARVVYRGTESVSMPHKLEREAKAWCERRAGEMACDWHAEMARDSMAKVKEMAREAGNKDGRAAGLQNDAARIAARQHVASGDAARLSCASALGFVSGDWRAAWRSYYDSAFRFSMRSAMAEQAAARAAG